MPRVDLEDPLFKDGERFRAWYWMVAKAVWKATSFDVRGSIIELQRGQFCASREQLAKEFGWSPSAVERFLSRLQSGLKIARDTGQGKSIITILNYDIYQPEGKKVGQSNGQSTGQKSDRNRTAKEQGNKGTRVEEDAEASPSPQGAGESQLPLGDDDQPAKRKSTKGIRKTGVDHPLPDDWEPRLGPKAEAIIADWPEDALAREEFKFRNHAALNGRVVKNWDAAFGNWLAIADERISNGRKSNRSGGGGRHREREEGDGLDRYLRSEMERSAARRSGQSSGAAGRHDAGESGGDRLLPFARPGKN